MRITLLGTGDAPGTPIVGCTCATCRDAMKGTRSNRTRYSVLIQNEFTEASGEIVTGNVLIDSGPDIRSQLLREGISGRSSQLSQRSCLPTVIDAFIFTHAHFDHFGGLGDFYRVQPTINGYGVEDTLRSIYGFFSYLSPKFHTVEPYTSFSLIGLRFTLFDVVHQPIKHPVGVIVQNDRSKVVITSDCNANIPEKSLDFMKDPDLFIANAIVPDNDQSGPICKHMNSHEARLIAKKIRARKTVLSHLSHYYPPHDEAISLGYPVGWDGMKFDL